MSVATKTDLLAAVEKTSFRLSLLLRSSTHPDKKACGVWSVAETANHVAHCYPAFIEAFLGNLTVAPEEVDAQNAAQLAADTERDLDVLADRLENGMREYLAVAGSVDEEDLVDFFTGMLVPASGVTATLLGEVLVHGYDIARAEKLPWLIEPEHAILTLQSLGPVMVHFVDEAAAADLEAGFEIKLRGGTPSYWYFSKGELHVEASPVEPVDCHISADPVTFMLMSYNRIGPTMPALSGKVRVWGRKPWLATRLGGVFKT